MYLKNLKKLFKNKIYYPAEVFYGYVEERRDGKRILDINPDVITSYKCNACRCHTPYTIFLVEGFIDNEHARENLYRCPFCKTINLIPDYNADDKRRENLFSNEEVRHIHGGKKYRESEEK